LCLCAPLSALAQGTPATARPGTPDEDWATPFAPRPAPAEAPQDSTADVPSAGEQTPPPMPSLRPATRVVAARPPVPEDFNNVSVYGAPTLGQWKRGIGIYIGFPLLGAEFALGLLNKLDAAVSFESMYGTMEDFRLHLKWQFLSGKNWSASAVAEGGPAIFAEPPQAEGNGPRWLTGRRDWNLAPGLILSYRGDSPHSPRLFVDGRYALSFDTEPYETQPLQGIPPSVTVGGNETLRAGAEMPFSPKTSFLFVLGFDVHNRPQDSPFMIDVSVGIVTSI
jgi:hypothetical protein